MKHEHIKWFSIKNSEKSKILEKTAKLNNMGHNKKH